MPYLTTSTTYSPRGEHVTIYNHTHHPVMLVENSKGIKHSVHLDNLQDEPVVEIITEIIEPILPQLSLF